MRYVLAVSLAVIAHAPAAAESGQGAVSPEKTQLAVVAASASGIKALDRDARTPVLALDWSLAQAQDLPAPAPSNAQAGTEELEGPPPSSDEADGQDDGDVSQDDPITQDDEIPDGNEIIVDGEYGPPRNDPAEALNYESYRITQAVDDALVEPVAYAYRDGLPTSIRDGLGNVVRNLGEPVNALNFLLQGKFGKALGSLTRLLINSTLGLGGVFDMAEKPGIGIPYRRNGFANTLGFYGVEPGAYLYLPFTGATSVRDLIGSGLDQLVLPVAVGAPFNRPEYTVPFFIVSSLDVRLEVDEELARIDATVDPYAARRDTYLARRAREIALLRGEEPPKPPLILLEIEGVIEPGDDYPEDIEGAGEEAPPQSLNLERGVVVAGQIR